MANYCKIKFNDIANGDGIRTSVFISGCTHRCKGCFNEEAWDFNAGNPLDASTIVEIINSANPKHISGITLLGGDPLCGDDNQAASHALCHMFKAKHPNKTIWLYTGYLYEDIKHLPVIEHVDILVDGLFIESKKSLMLKFRGSENQRVINVQESLKADQVILDQRYY